MERDIKDAFGRLERKLDEVVSTSNENNASLRRIDSLLDASKQSVEDHEERIRWLERTIYKAAGAAAGIGGVLGSIVHFLFGGKTG